MERREFVGILSKVILVLPFMGTLEKLYGKVKVSPILPRPIIKHGIGIDFKREFIQGILDDKEYHNGT